MNYEKIVNLCNQSLSIENTIRELYILKGIGVESDNLDLRIFALKEELTQIAEKIKKETK